MKKESLLSFVGHLKYKIVTRFDEKYISKIRYKMLNNKEFTIISNNCWAGWVYRRFGLKYQTPTIGLFIMPEDYIKFINRLSHYINDCSLKFIKPNASKHYELLKNNEKYGTYPIAQLDDIEIFFMHYKNETEAIEKWNRRKNRINWDNLIIKFNDQNGCDKQLIDEFNRINGYKKMICFVAKNIPGKRNIYMWEFKKDGYVVDDKYWCPQHVNLKKFIDK